MTVPVPAWLAPADVKAWLRITPADTVDDDLLARVSSAVEPAAQRARPEFTDPDTAVYSPDPEVYQAAVQMAARLYRRRNSAAGVEQMTDNALYVARYDPDLERALHTGAWAPPRVG